MVGLHGRRGAAPHPRRPGGPGSGAGAGRSTGARGRRRATASGCARSASTATATPCWCWSTSTATGPATPGAGPASTARSADGAGSAAPGGRRRPGRPGERPASRRRAPLELRPGPDEFAALAADHADRAGVARAGGRHPHPGGRLPQRGGRGPGLPARVGRGGRALGPLLLRRPRPAGHPGGPGPPGDGHRGRLAVPDRRRPGRAGRPRGAAGAYRSPVLADLPPLHGGLVGYLGYDVVREVEHLPDVPPDDLGLPRRRPHGDRPAGRLRPLAPAGGAGRQRGGRRRAGRAAEAEAAYDAAGRRLAELAADCFRPVGRAGPDARPPGRDAAGRADPHHGSPAVHATPWPWPRSTSRPGTSSRWCCPSASTSTSGPTPSTSTAPCAWSTRAPTCTSCALDEVTVVGSSPEPMVRLRDGVVTSRPIAGSRAAGRHRRRTTGCWPASWPRTPRSWPSTSCWSTWPATTWAGWSSFGTEHVDELMTVERYSHVMHLTSQVSGRLAPGKGPIDVLRATLPAGTLSGAPKVRAMQIIDDLEPTKRGIYGGVVGYLDFSGNLDTAIAIRTMVVGPRRPGLGPGRGGHRGRQRPGGRGRRVRPQGGRPAGRGGRRPGDGRPGNAAGERRRAPRPARRWPRTTAALRHGLRGPPGRARRRRAGRPRRRRLPPGPVQPGRGRAGDRGSGRRPPPGARRQARRPGPGDPHRPRTASSSTSTRGYGAAVAARLARFRCGPRWTSKRSPRPGGGCVALRGPGATGRRRRTVRRGAWSCRSTGTG